MVSFEKPKLPKVLYIHESKRNAEIGKYQAILVNENHHKVLDILRSRTFSYYNLIFLPIQEKKENGSNTLSVTYGVLIHSLQTVYSQTQKSSQIDIIL